MTRKWILAAAAIAVISPALAAEAPVAPSQRVIVLNLGPFKTPDKTLTITLPEDVILESELTPDQREFLTAARVFLFGFDWQYGYGQSSYLVKDLPCKVFWFAPRNAPPSLSIVDPGPIDQWRVNFNLMPSPDDATVDGHHTFSSIAPWAFDVTWRAFANDAYCHRPYYANDGRQQGSQCWITGITFSMPDNYVRRLNALRFIRNNWCAGLPPGPKPPY
jgi:hypothetical protein